MRVRRGLTAIFLALAAGCMASLSSPRTAKGVADNRTPGLGEGHLRQTPVVQEASHDVDSVGWWRSRSAKLRQSRAKALSPRAPAECAAIDTDGPSCSGSTCCSGSSADFQCCDEGFKCCVTSTGSSVCCPTDGSSGPAATATITRTITSFTSTTTAIVVSTVTETLTFVNPAAVTQFSITTVFRTNSRRAGARSALPTDPAKRSLAVETTAPKATLARSGRGRRDPGEPATTVEVTTVVPSIATVTTTVFDTVFVTVTLAPDAKTTVVSTTTADGPPPSSTNDSTSRPNTQTGSIPAGTSSDASFTFVIPPAPPLSGSAPVPTSASTISSASSQTSLSTSLSSTTVSTFPSSTSSSTGSSSSSSISSSSGGISTTSPTTMFTSTSVTPTISSGAPMTTSTTPESPPPLNSPLTSAQIAGVIISAIFLLICLILLAFFAHWLVRRRRSQLAEQRQRITPPMSKIGGAGAAAGGLFTGRQPGDTTPSDGGPRTGEVRIVIRPPPGPGGSSKPPRSSLWPMPPGHRGQAYSFYAGTTTTGTGQTTPQDPGTWSIASERGSVRPTRGGPPTTRSRAGESSSASGGAASTSGAAASGSGGASGPTGQSLISVGWGTSVATRSEVGSMGYGPYGEALAPPPPVGRGGRGGRRGRDSGPSDSSGDGRGSGSIGRAY